MNACTSLNIFDVRYQIHGNVMNLAQSRSLSLTVEFVFAALDLQEVWRVAETFNSPFLLS